MPDPYYNFEDVGRAFFGLKDSDESSALKEETFAGSSYSAELFLHLMTRYNLKQPCQESWPKFNRLCHKRFIPAQFWQYGLLKCTEGVEETRQYPFEYTWEKLCEESSVETCDYLPEGLSDKPHLLLLWLIIAPHRLTSDVGRVLDAKLKCSYQQPAAAAKPATLTFPYLFGVKEACLTLLAVLQLPHQKGGFHNATDHCCHV